MLKEIKINDHVTIKEVENNLYHLFFDNYRIYSELIFTNYNYIDSKHTIRHKHIKLNPEEYDLDLDLDFPAFFEGNFNNYRSGYSAKEYGYIMIKHENNIFIKNMNGIHTIFIDDLKRFQYLSNEYFCAISRDSILVYDFETITLICTIPINTNYPTIYLNNDKTLTVKYPISNYNSYNYMLYNLDSELLLEANFRGMKWETHYYNKDYKLFIAVATCNAFFVHDMINNEIKYIGLYYKPTFTNNKYFYNHNKNFILNMALENTNYKQKRNLYKIEKC